jgi:ABC-type sugar transport system substrate-binding protein
MSEVKARRPYRRSVTRALWCAAILAIVGAALSACGSSSDSSSSSTSGSSGGGGSVDGKKAFLIMAPPSIPYSARQTEVITQQLAKQGIDTTAYNDNYTPDGEVAGLNEAIAKKVDVIGYQANFQASSRAALAKAKAAGIPVVLLATPPEPVIKGLYTSYAGPNEPDTGSLVAKGLQDQLAANGVKSGKIAALLGLASSYSVKIRQAGFDSQMATTPGFQVVGYTDGRWDPARTVTQGNQIVAQYGHDLVGMYVHGGVQAAAVATAAKRAGLKVGTKPGEVVIVSNNCDATSVKAIKDGTLLFTTQQGPATDGLVEAKAMVKALQGHPQDMETPNVVVNADNVDKFAKDCTY